MYKSIESYCDSIENAVNLANATYMQCQGLIDYAVESAVNDIYDGLLQRGIDISSEEAYNKSLAGCKRSFGQWRDCNRNVVVNRHNSGAMFVRSQCVGLWNLTDYVVSSVCYGGVWVVPIAPAARPPS
jgi:hypothetical protein